MELATFRNDKNQRIRCWAFGDRSLRFAPHCKASCLSSPKTPLTLNPATRRQSVQQDSEPSAQVRLAVSPAGRAPGGGAAPG